MEALTKKIFENNGLARQFPSLKLARGKRRKRRRRRINLCQNLTIVTRQGLKNLNDIVLSEQKPFDIIPGMPHPMLISSACHNISLLKSLTKLDMSTAYENIPANLYFNSSESTRKTLVHRCSQFIPVQVYTRVLAANLFERGLEFPPRLLPQHYRTISKSYEERDYISMK